MCFGCSVSALISVCVVVVYCVKPKSSIVEIGCSLMYATSDVLSLSMAVLDSSRITRTKITQNLFTERLGKY